MQAKWDVRMQREYGGWENWEKEESLVFMSSNHLSFCSLWLLILLIHPCRDDWCLISLIRPCRDGWCLVSLIHPCRDDSCLVSLIHPCRDGRCLILFLIHLCRDDYVGFRLHAWKYVRDDTLHRKTHCFPANASLQSGFKTRAWIHSHFYCQLLEPYSEYVLLGRDELLATHLGQVNDW